MSKTASIPEFFEGDLRSMAASLRAVKQQLETLSGQRQGQSQGAPAVYVQTTEPAPSRISSYKIGDFWINPEKPKGEKLSFYDGRGWVQM